MKRRNLSIMAKLTLLSWLVASTTLAVFVIAILPLERSTFLKNLDSKARGVAVSLRDVTASAVVNEDYSTVVDHCKEMLNGDESLAFLVITKNDGFSLVSERNHWRAEERAGKEWRPDKREAFGGIEVVPLFNKRFYHYAQPFGYSGIEWGWIHVGLSLKDYDASVAALVRRTILLAVGCMLLSLGASVAHAIQIVRPILRLRAVVQNVADGDLSARAEIARRDELGSLAGSVNTMTEALLRRDRILQAVRFAAEKFLSRPDWESVIGAVMAKLGEATGVSAIRIYENRPDIGTQLPVTVSYEWLAAGAPRLEAGFPEEIRPVAGSVARGWIGALRRGETLALETRSMENPARAYFLKRGIQSELLIPIMFEETCWGTLALDDCAVNRVWTNAERDSLRAAADMLGAAVVRKRTQDALVEAKETLELRVSERTSELSRQMAEKEKAHAALAEAQQKLIEASHRAGMAEVATGVLHNVGNVLNSVNVSATLARETIRDSEVASLVRVVDLMEAHAADLPEYLASDPKGSQIPGFLRQLASHLSREHERLLREHEQLGRNIEHIKEIVVMQQDYARVSGILEKVSIIHLVEDALRMNEAGFSRQGVKVVRRFSEVPLVTTDRHKVIQILINLLRNAKYAVDVSGRPDKMIIISVERVGDDRIRVDVSDNGIGIASENLTRIFSHGFTTRKDGHGFGLHSGANSARDLGGSLNVHSDGPGKGAVFTLDLPIQSERPAP